MAALSPPTRLQGTVSDGTYDAWLGEALEQIPALVYPLSVETYAAMRRDPQLAAILAGYTLQIRRASWSVNPAGCRPEVAQLVADDLGLPVTGDDTPKSARVRGVSWAEHVRAALTCLTYGHAGFEMLAEVRGERARLSMLAERPAHTITAIYADARSGAFQGVTQDVPGRLDVPQIKADRMVWYCHEREGNSWQGTSLLRPAYGPWLLKRELQRVLATSSRRFGMGVPTVKALPGTLPTETQMTAALNLATSARVGDQGGAAVPPGFTFELVGMSGSTPDTLGFIRYLDQQMSRMALMSHLDLGTSESGSRSLGESFVDVLMMSVQAVGETLADTITRQAAARIVEWNYGLDEPVPAVTVSGIGDRREITAEALDLLLRSGALSADPALEAHIRREWRLPERTAPTPTPPPAPAAVSAGRRAPRRSRKEPAPGQLALPILAAAPARDVTVQEEAAGVDPAVVQQQWQQQVDAVAAQWSDAADPMADGVSAAVVAAVAAGTLPAVIAAGGLAVSAAVVAGLAGLLAAGMVALAAASSALAADEAAHQGVTIDVPEVDEDALASHAAAIAQVIAAGYVSGAAQVALANAGPGVDAETVGRLVRDHLDGVTATAASGEAAGRGWVVTNLASALSQAQATGRMATFEALEAAGHTPRYVASEVNDRNVCAPCASIDGTTFPTLADARAAYPLGQHIACLGGARCRGFLFAVVE
ncbi:hypothetical protein ACH4T9_12545 [Micromonospora sp. NPDC020750]|uniref:phage portal protein family protein n=1 Tax=unclassified Micromonospora TaxID=2617518 RepID=UPI00378D175F